ncbi:hypothetical protein [Schaedlerella sp.]|uniref:hypothetical protein n=1 Tax=Schaedlerella sp. TaxID=2676057 RepID=UPI003744C7AF
MGEKEISNGERMIQTNVPYRIEMKLLSPLAGVFFRKCRHGKKGDEEEPGREMDDRELADHEEAIRKAVDKVNSPEIEGGNPFDLMEECFDGSPSIQEKVEHGVISVENVEGVLYGCTTLLLKEALEAWELEEMCEYISMQYSDGWGEVFEQRDIPADGGIIRVYFDPVRDPDFQIQSKVIKNPNLENQKNDISDSGKSAVLKTEEQNPQMKKPRPILSLTRCGRHIFSVLSGAMQILIKTGQREEADEMYDRVSKVQGYEESLAIICEYVEIEPDSAREKETQGEQKKKPEQGRER